MIDVFPFHGSTLIYTKDIQGRYLAQQESRHTEEWGILRGETQRIWPFPIVAKGHFCLQRLCMCLWPQFSDLPRCALYRHVEPKSPKRRCWREACDLDETLMNLGKPSGNPLWWFSIATFPSAVWLRGVTKDLVGCGVTIHLENLSTLSSILEGKHGESAQGIQLSGSNHLMLEMLVA